jgi:glucoamylase
MLHWTDDEWNTARDTSSIPTAIKMEYVDLEIDAAQKAPLRFTFYWPLDNQWQGKDYVVEIEQPTHANATTRKAVAGE